MSLLVNKWPWSATTASGLNYMHTQVSLIYSNDEKIKLQVFTKVHNFLIHNNSEKVKLHMLTCTQESLIHKCEKVKLHMLTCTQESLIHKCDTLGMLAARHRKYFAVRWCVSEIRYSFLPEPTCKAVFVFMSALE